MNTFNVVFFSPHMLLDLICRCCYFCT